jgi:AP2 domain
MSMRVPLTRGYETLVDEADYDRVMAAGPWHAHGSGILVYARRHVDMETREFLHRFLTEWGLTDHRDGDGLNNQRSNLRPATKALNNANRGLPRNSTSGFKGVHRLKVGARFQAYIRIGARRHHLGTFGSAEDAAKAYDWAARRLFGEYARLNFPDVTAWR